MATVEVTSSSSHAAEPIKIDDEQNPIILFDGVCNLCQSTVQFVIRRDPDKKFRFASLQSEVAQQLLQQYEGRDDSLTSVILLTEGKQFRKSQAALQIAKRLKQPWPLMYYMFAWLPTVISDLVYDFIGKRRYRWFGKKEACWLPDESLSHMFFQDP